MGVALAAAPAFADDAKNGDAGTDTAPQSPAPDSMDSVAACQELVARLKALGQSDVAAYENIVGMLAQQKGGDAAAANTATVAHELRERVTLALAAFRTRLATSREELKTANTGLTQATAKGMGDKQAKNLSAQSTALGKLLDSITQRLDALEGTPATQSASDEATSITRDVGAAADAVKAFSDTISAQTDVNGEDLVDVLLSSRCQTAICFDSGTSKNWLGIEPLVELPVGKSFAVGRSAMSDYVNNHDLRVDLAAGLRIWFLKDVLSASIYISKPLTDASVRTGGSAFVYPGSAVHRPYPGVAIGLLYDSIWLGFDRDELRNGDANDKSALNPDYPPNQSISSTWTVTLALQPVTAFRSAIGAAVHSSNQNKGLNK
jgi:hypothetical protein